MKARKRLYGLDVFRIILALITFMFHTAIHFNCTYGVLQGFIRNGAVVMSGFFILSGYSLFYVCREHELTKINNIVYFYKKRILGLFPVYYVSAIIYTIFIAPETPLQKVLLFPIEILGLQSIYDSLFSVGHNGGTWFISCFLICYLTFPLLQIICKQISNRAKLILFLLCCFVLFISPFIIKVFELSSIYSNPFFRLLEFAMGVILASAYAMCTKYIFIYKIFVNKVTIIVMTIWIILFISVCNWRGIGSGNYMFLSIGTLIPLAIIVYNLGNLEFGKIISNKVVLYLSSLSYSFFLSQLFMPKLGKLIFEYFDCPNILKILVLLSLCVVISITLRELVEKPCGKLWKHLKFI